MSRNHIFHLGQKKNMRPCLVPWYCTADTTTEFPVQLLIERIASRFPSAMVYHTLEVLKWTNRPYQGL